MQTMRKPDVYIYFMRVEGVNRNKTKSCIRLKWVFIFIKSITCLIVTKYTSVHFKIEQLCHRKFTVEIFGQFFIIKLAVFDLFCLSCPYILSVKAENIVFCQLYAGKKTVQLFIDQD